MTPAPTLLLATRAGQRLVTRSGLHLRIRGLTLGRVDRPRLAVAIPTRGVARATPNRSIHPIGS